MHTTDETISALCARCDSAGYSASESLKQLAAQAGPRNRAKWRREHVVRVGMLDRAAHALMVALHVQPFAPDAISPAIRIHAERVHGFACKHLAVLRS